MTKHEQATQSFASPSPGELLRRHAVGRQSEPVPVRQERANSPVDLACNPFAPNPFMQALQARGVMLAPLLVQWNYKVSAALPFSKWLKTKEVLLSDARLQVNDDTFGVHYFGTYIVQDATRDAATGDDDTGSAVDCPTAACLPAACLPAARLPATCQTLWGYSDEAAMTHMFDLCRGQIGRVSIVQNDLKDFVIGLKRHIALVEPAHFSQTVLLAPAAM